MTNRNTIINKDNIDSTIKNCLKAKEFDFVNNDEFNEFINTNKQVFTKQIVVGENPYKLKHKLDYLIQLPNKSNHLLGIMYKYQGMSGSSERKLVFDVASIEKNNISTLLILEGGGFSKGCIDWAKSQELKVKNLEKVLTLSEFTDYIDSRL